jgi:membrane fusion protein (multidrug efflux system)
MSDTIKADRTTDRTSADAAQSNHKATQDRPAGTSPNATPPAASGKRKLWLALLGIGVVVGSAAYGAYYFTYGQYHESTDDAYVNGNLVELTPQVTGTVNAVNTDDTQIVKVGDPVVTLDPADSRIALLNAEAALGQAVRKVSTLYVNNDYYAANVAQRESDLARAKDDLQRRVAVASTGAASSDA